MRRFIIIVLDSLGIGYMDDVTDVRPQDIGANTLKHILLKNPDLKLPNLERLGIMNALGEEAGNMKKSKTALFGRAALMHEGADTFLGHQEIMGTKPKRPVFEPFANVIDKVYAALRSRGFQVEYMGDRAKFLLVNKSVAVGDNIEADLGQAYNLTGMLDYINFEDELKIGRIVRENSRVSRVITFGGRGVNIDRLMKAVEIKNDKYIGINAPESGVYDNDYHCIHMGYGIDPEVQVPTILGKAGIEVSLFGKVADIVSNEYGKSVSCVDTGEVMELTCRELLSMKEGFICTNVQETDLAGHEQDVLKYAEKLRIADKYIGIIMDMMADEDRLIVMADHGNDPTIGHSHHTREYVPVLMYGKNIKPGFLGTRKTLSDAGATAAEFFHAAPPENGRALARKAPPGEENDGRTAKITPGGGKKWLK